MAKTFEAGKSYVSEVGGFEVHNTLKTDDGKSYAFGYWSSFVLDGPRTVRTLRDDEFSTFEEVVTS